MKAFLRPLLLLLLSSMMITPAFSQTAPVITYSPSTDVYTVNSTITALSPANAGGTVTNGALTTFSTDATGGPYGIAYDPVNGDIITNSFSGGAVYIYSPTGTLITTYTTDIGGSGPKDIVVDNSGNIYVANPVGEDVVKITPAGVFSNITGSPTVMNTPDGMCIDASGNIYVADQSTDIIYKIAPGATTATVYAKGFTDLYGVTVNSAGQVYASQYAASSTIGNSLYTVTSGSTSGGTTLLYSTTFASNSSFRNLSIDASGDIYVADEGLGEIIKVVPGATAATTTESVLVSGLTNPRATAFDKNGNTYIANSGGDDIKEYSPGGYSIDIPLPAGMSFSTTTGVISGTPTVTSAATTYTIAAHNASGTGYTTVVITVDPSGPTAPGVTLCGTGTANLTATAGAPSGGTFNWYSAATGGTAIATGSTYSPSVTTTTTFYVDYTQGSVTCAARTAVTVTVGADPVISTAPAGGAYFSYGFTAGSVTDLSGSGNNGTTHGSPTTTIDRYNTAGNALSFVSSSSQYISTNTASTLPGPQTFSLSIWFETTTAGGYLVGFGSSQTGASLSADRLLYMGTNGEVYFGIAPLTIKTTINSTIAYNDGKWHHAVATFSTADGSNLYMDGALVASNPAMNTVLSVAGYWRVGYDSLTGWPNAPTTSYFNGSLDDVAVANTELTYAGVDVLYGAGSGTYCSGNTMSLTANTVSGATYSWVGPAGSGFTSTSQNPTVTATQAIAGVYVLTVTSATGCTSVINVTAPGNAITYTWSGAAGTTSLTTAGNWDHLPPFTSTSNLVIPTGLSAYPVLTANESVYGLTIGNTATISLNGFTLSVGCNIVNNASVANDGIIYNSNNSSGITWNGTVAAQTYAGNNTNTSAELGNMTVNNSAGGTVTINNGPIDIFHTLTITEGNLAVGSSPGALNLKSTATQTANVAPIPSAYSISGNVTAERYITGGTGYRGYRLISSPVYTTPVSPNYVFSINYLQNSMLLTGNSGGGFDKTGNPTLYLFREDQIPSNVTFTSGNFWGISAINNTPSYGYYVNGVAAAYNLPVGNGVMVFFRGNRASASVTAETVPTYTPVTVTLSTTGPLTQGNVVVHNWYTPGSASIAYTGTSTNATTSNYSVRGFNLVGNPYASSIDWSTFSNTNPAAAIYGALVGPTIWLFNAQTKNYNTYNATTGVSTGAANKIIASGQGFFVQATAASPALTFTEAAKSSSQPTTLLMDSRVTVNAFSPSLYNSYLRLKLITDSVNNDDIVVGFNSAATPQFKQGIDDRFVTGSGMLQSISARSTDSVLTSVKWLPYAKNEVLPLKVGVNTTGLYTIERTDFNAIPQLYEVWLMDNYKKDSLDIRANTTYAFNVDINDTATYGKNRFSVVLRQNPALMVHLLNFTAVKAVSGSQVGWVTENEANYTTFALQRSIDGGKTYQVLDSLLSGAQGSYNYLDAKPATGANTYRLQITDLNGSITYSSIITIMYGNTTNSLVKTGMMVYPNPAISTVNIDFAPGLNATAVPSASASTSSLAYNVKITSMVGSVVKTASVSQQTWQTDVSELLPGTYIIQVTSKTDNSVIGEQKFIKL